MRFAFSVRQAECQQLARAHVSREEAQQQRDRQLREEMAAVVNGLQSVKTAFLQTSAINKPTVRMRPNVAERRERADVGAPPASRHAAAVVTHGRDTVDTVDDEPCVSMQSESPVRSQVRCARAGSRRVGSRPISDGHPPMRCEHLISVGRTVATEPACSHHRVSPHRVRVGSYVC